MKFKKIKNKKDAEKKAKELLDNFKKNNEYYSSKLDDFYLQLAFFSCYDPKCYQFQYAYNILTGYYTNLYNRIRETDLLVANEITSILEFALYLDNVLDDNMPFLIMPGNFIAMMSDYQRKIFYSARSVDLNILKGGFCSFVRGINNLTTLCVTSVNTYNFLKNENIYAGNNMIFTKFPAGPGFKIVEYLANEDSIEYFRKKFPNIKK